MGLHQDPYARKRGLFLPGQRRGELEGRQGEHEGHEPNQDPAPEGLHGAEAEELADEITNALALGAPKGTGVMWSPPRSCETTE